MSSISNLSALLRPQLPEPRVVGPQSDATASARSDAALPTFRSAAAGFSAFSVSITAASRSAGGLQELLGRELDTLFGVLNKGQDPSGFVSKALDSLKELTERAIEDPSVSGLQIRISSVNQQFRAEGTDESVFSSVSQLSIEVGLVRENRIAAGDIELLSFQGKKLSLTESQKQTGIVSGLFKVEDENTETAGPANKAQAAELEKALERLKLVNDALAAFRRGDLGPLQDVERLFRGGTLDAEGIRALSRAKDVTESAVFPGSGVLDL